MWYSFSVSVEWYYFLSKPGKEPTQVCCWTNKQFQLTSILRCFRILQSCYFFCDRWHPTLIICDMSMSQNLAWQTHQGTVSFWLLWPFEDSSEIHQVLFIIFPSNDKYYQRKRHTLVDLPICSPLYIEISKQQTSNQKVNMYIHTNTKSGYRCVRMTASSCDKSNFSIFPTN